MSFEDFHLISREQGLIRSIKGFHLSPLVPIHHLHVPGCDNRGNFGQERASQVLFWGGLAELSSLSSIIGRPPMSPTQRHVSAISLKAATARFCIGPAVGFEAMLSAGLMDSTAH